MTGDGFKSMKARQLLRLLGRLGYSEKRRSGSHRHLVCEGRPTLLFAHHDGATLAPGLVRSTLINDVGLSHAEALEVIRNG